MRTKNSFLNFMANTGSHLSNVILSFICRTVFIYVLSEEYLGVNGLFGNVLTVLSLAELGIGGAMTFHLYKPIAEEDERAIRQMMNLYRVLYTCVGAFVGIAGLALVPFLDIFIKDRPDIPGLTFIYLLYLLNTVCSYLWGYKRAIIDGHQKSYIGTIYNTIFTTIQFLIQIVILLVSRNFIAYLLVQIVCSIATNIAVARKADRMYPYLKENRKELPPKETRRSIAKNVGAMSLHKLGDVVVNNTDNLIMSAFVGIVAVGAYSNYQMIQATINTALNGVFGAFTASIGNLGVDEENRDKVYHVYQVLLFLGFWLYGFSTIAFLILFNPFILAWTGKSNLVFSMPIVLVYVINFYVAGMRKVTITFRDAMGLYWYDRYKPILEVIVDMAVTIVLVLKLGTIGILLGTLISAMTTCFWIEPLVTYKYGFYKPVRKYFFMFAKYTATVAVVGGFTYWVCSFFSIGGFAEVFLKLLICIVIYNFLIFLLYFRTKEFKALWVQATILLANYKNRKRG